MKAAAFLALYERVADAPDAIARLRRFVLDLAVRGKLVEQEAADEPVSKLMGHSLATDIDAVRSGRKSKIIPAGTDILLGTFEIPATWTWVRIGDIFVYDAGIKRAPSSLDPTLWLLELEDIEKETGKLLSRPTVSERDSKSTKSEFAVGDVLYGKLRPYLTKVLVADQRGYSTTEIVAIRPRIPMCSDYCALALRRPDFVDYVSRLGQGTKMPRLRTEDAVVAPFPLPPLAEQHRIVAKVDELMALLDRRDAARRAREATRDRLTAASLTRLTAADTDPEALRTHARFALDALPALTTRADQIKQLRQTILNLAVRGKLLEQDPSEESAGKLVERVGALPDPARYSKRSPEVIPGDCGLSINRPAILVPSGWSWVPLIRIARIESGHTPSRHRPDWWDGDVPWIGLVDARIHNNGKIFETIQHTNPEGLANSAARLLPAGTVCFSRTASVGYVVVMGRPMATSQDFVNWVPTASLASEWLQLVMIAERPAIPRFSKGAVHQTIYYPAWLSMHIALPPLAEQHRIVAKVDELMALCDRLEAALQVADTSRSRLLEALLHEARNAPADNIIDFAEAGARLRSRRSEIGALIVQHQTKRGKGGRIKLGKSLYLAEAHCGLALGGRFGRAEYGPHDAWIYVFEREAGSAGWFTFSERPLGNGSTRVEYTRGPTLDAKAEEARAGMGGQPSELERVLDLLAPLTAEEAEIAATLFAAWNDLLIEGEAVSDEVVITEVREHWHPSKARFTPEVLKQWLGWLRRNGLVPRGQGPSTRQQGRLI